jgi:8-oxo-dGTP diphosphatase
VRLGQKIQAVPRSARISTRELIDVAAAALLDGGGRVLIAQRPAGKAHAGRWEFPGGKFESGESATAALARELREEIGVDIRDAELLCTLEHDYPQRRVRLHLFVVERYVGEPVALDGQALKWVSLGSLATEDILEADRPFVVALQQRFAAAI